MNGQKFTLAELDQSGEVAPSSVIFTWDAAHQSSPRNGWPYGVRLRTIREDYAGGAAPPTEQVLGWSFEPFTLEGAWDDRYNEPGFAEDVRVQFEALVQRGNPVRLQFEGIVFEGLIVQFSPLYRRRGYIQYAFTVSPHRRGKSDFKADIVTPQVKQAGEIDQRIDELLTRARLEQETAPHQISVTDVFAMVDAAMNEWQRQANDLHAYLTVRASGVSAKRHALGVLGTLKSSAENLLPQLNGTNSGVAQAFPDPISEIAFEIWMRSSARNAREIIRLSAEAQSSLDIANATDVRLYRATAGESLYSISLKFFGTPFEWQAIADANGLTTFTLDGSRLLIIPPLAQVAA